MTAVRRPAPGSAGGGGQLAGTAGSALFGLEARELFSVDQEIWPVLLGLQVIGLDVAPQHRPGHADPVSGLGDRQQLSLLHAGKGTESVPSVIGYHGCGYSLPAGKIDTGVANKGVIGNRRRSCRWGSVPVHVRSGD